MKKRYFLAVTLAALLSAFAFAVPAHADKGTFGTETEPLTTLTEILNAMNAAGTGGGSGNNGFSKDDNTNTIFTTGGTLRNRIYIHPENPITFKLSGSGMGIQSSNAGITIVDGQVTVKNETGNSVNITKFGRSTENVFQVGKADPDGNSPSGAKLIFDGKFTLTGTYLANILNGEVEVTGNSTIETAATKATGNQSTTSPMFAVGGIVGSTPQNEKTTAKLTINGTVDVSKCPDSWSAIVVTGGEQAICHVGESGHVKGRDGKFIFNMGGGPGGGGTQTTKYLPLIQVGNAEIPATLIVEGEVAYANEGAAAILVQGGANSTVTIKGEKAHVKGGSAEEPAIKVGYAGEESNKKYPPSGGTLIINSGNVENANPENAAIKSVTGSTTEYGEPEVEMTSDIQINGGEIKGNVDMTGPGSLTVGGEGEPTITGGITNENDDSTIDIKSGTVEKNVTNNKGTTNVGIPGSEVGPEIAGDAENQDGILNVYGGQVKDVTTSGDDSETNLLGGNVKGSVSNTGTASKVVIDGAEIKGNVTTNGENAKTEINTGKVGGDVTNSQGQTTVGKPGAENPPTVSGTISGEGTDFYDAVDDEGQPKDEPIGVDVYITLTFDPEYGTLTSEQLQQTHKKGEFTTVTDPGNPTREGYNFLGWVVKGTDEVVDLNTWKPEANTTLVPKWEKIVATDPNGGGNQNGGNQNGGNNAKYTVTFDANGGTWSDGNVKTQDVASGKTVIAPENPTREGYTFLGWMLEDKAVDVTSVKVAKALTFKASWEKVSLGDQPGDDEKPPTQTPDSVAVYRVYNPYDGQHLLTTDANEYAYLKTLGWNQEGVSFRAANEGDAVYRLYNPNNGDHIYTTDRNEYDTLQKNNGWIGEDIAFYSDTKPDAKPIYRLWNPYQTTNGGLGSHLWTSSYNEYSVLAGLGWNQEGLAWFAESI